jgi:hypothetical protein
VLGQRLEPRSNGRHVVGMHGAEQFHRSRFL